MSCPFCDKPCGNAWCSYNKQEDDMIHITNYLDKERTNYYWDAETNTEIERTITDREMLNKMANSQLNTKWSDVISVIARTILGSDSENTQELVIDLAKYALAKHKPMEFGSRTEKKDCDYCVPGQQCNCPGGGYTLKVKEDDKK